ncbi:AAA family ATPase [Devosia rhizoryzae]|uniref:AAA family ATPase n=1 Tax=Devosia rhizoryzae TaxID=2774137 RepID=A0ABX7C8X0_9HYPH|nr:AAA family ATPase [Devosia rhizoryzae]QQR38411.1 AAA family ATPase [Devosia rhizoryzae]
MPKFEAISLAVEDNDFDTADPVETEVDDKPLRPERLLVEALLKGRTAAVRAALRSTTPQVIHLVSPSAGWAHAISRAIKRSNAQVRTLTVTDVRKDRNEWIVSQVQTDLSEGLHIILSTPAAPGLLPSKVHGAIDLRLELPPIDVAGVNRAIRGFCGQRASGLVSADIERLDFLDLIFAMRPNSTARDCVRRIRALAENQRSQNIEGMKARGPRLEDLPLPAAVRGWALGCLDELSQVSAGRLDPQQLRFAVLEGPPGTGKTMIGESLARSAGWRLVPATMGGWFNDSDGNLGGVSKAIVAFFDRVLEHDYSVGFIDELDALPDRASLDARDRQWWVPIVTLFLKQIDRVRSSGKSVMIIGATNYVERLDGALLRPLRMEQRVHVPVPESEDELRAIFAYYLAPDIPASELGVVASLAHGASPAQIESWCKEARSSAHHFQSDLTVEDVIDAVAPPDDRQPDEIRAVAIHEAGHAFVATTLGIEVKHVSIIARGDSGGVTRTVPHGQMLNREHLENIVTVLMAGRAADLLLGAHGAHSGAALDIRQASSLLMRGLCDWGLYDTLGQLDPSSEAAFDFADEAVKRLLHRALKLVTQNRQQVLVLASELQAQRFLKGEAVRQILNQKMTGGAAAKPNGSLSTRKPSRASSSMQGAAK